MKSEPIPFEKVGDPVQPHLAEVKQTYAVHPNRAGHAFAFRLDWVFGDAGTWTKDTRCTATEASTGKRHVLRLGQLRQLVNA